MMIMLGQNSASRSGRGSRGGGEGQSHCGSPLALPMGAATGANLVANPKAVVAKNGAQTLQPLLQDIGGMAKAGAVAVGKAAAAALAGQGWGPDVRQARSGPPNSLRRGTTKIKSAFGPKKMRAAATTCSTKGKKPKAANEGVRVIRISYHIFLKLQAVLSKLLKMDTSLNTFCNPMPEITGRFLETKEASHYSALSWKRERCGAFKVAQLYDEVRLNMSAQGKSASQKKKFLDKTLALQDSISTNRRNKCMVDPKVTTEKIAWSDQTYQIGNAAMKMQKEANESGAIMECGLRILAGLNNIETFVNSNVRPENSVDDDDFERALKALTSSREVLGKQTQVDDDDEEFESTGPSNMAGGSKSRNFGDSDGVSGLNLSSGTITVTVSGWLRG